MSNILICDWCKRPSQKEDLIKIIFDNAKSGKKFDICIRCQAEMFKRFETMEIARDYVNNKKKTISEMRRDMSREEKIQAIQNGDITMGPSKTAEIKPRVTGEIDKCYHLNKKTIIPKDNSEPYKECLLCGKKIPYKKPIDPNNVSVSEGVNNRD